VTQVQIGQHFDAGGNMCGKICNLAGVLSTGHATSLWRNAKHTVLQLRSSIRQLWFHQATGRCCNMHFVPPCMCIGGGGPGVVHHARVQVQVHSVCL
jgi:hypothetical protein